MGLSCAHCLNRARWVLTRERLQRKKEPLYSNNDEIYIPRERLQFLLPQFIDSCHDAQIAGIAIELLLTNYHEQRMPLGLVVQQDVQETA
jgi:hypothetical protein